MLVRNLFTSEGNLQGLGPGPFMITPTQAISVLSTFHTIAFLYVIVLSFVIFVYECQIKQLRLIEHAAGKLISDTSTT